MVKADLAFEAFAGLMVKGWIMQSFGLVMLTFFHDKEAAWIFSLIGTGEWGLGMSIFFFFLSDPQPSDSALR